MDSNFLRKLHRRSIRLKGYDYSWPGGYFVTICTQNRESLLGFVTDGVMQLNDVGQMVQSAWEQMPSRYPGIAPDAFVVMPNHVHGIILLGVGATPRGCPESAGQILTSRRVQGPGQAQRPAPTLTLPEVVHRFKSLTTAIYRREVVANHWTPFQGRFWQRNYYEHIIRGQEEFDRIREYIISNPSHWNEDELNPKNFKPVGGQ